MEPYMNNHLKRVVVTGIGAITPFGQNEDFFARLLKGDSAIGKLSEFSKGAMSYCHIAGQVRDFNGDDFVPQKTANRMDRFIQLAVAALSLIHI